MPRIGLKEVENWCVEGRLAAKCDGIGGEGGATAAVRWLLIRGEICLIYPIPAKVDALLTEAGSDKSKILSAQVWISNIGHFAQMNEVWDAWVSEGKAPARACIEARLASPDLLVEVGIVAAR